jgi:hypothetical protein
VSAGAASDDRPGDDRVVVEEQVTPTLTGRAPRSHEGPPHERRHALGLAGLLLGRDPSDLSGEGPWWQAIVVGRRTVTLAARR